MHVQFSPVYVLICGAHNSEPSLSFDLIIDFFGKQGSVLTKCECMMNFEPAASHGNWISKAVWRS